MLFCKHNIFFNLLTVVFVLVAAPLSFFYSPHGSNCLLWSLSKARQPTGNQQIEHLKLSRLFEFSHFRKSGKLSSLDNFAYADEKKITI